MYSPPIVDRLDSKWLLLEQILRSVSSWRSRQKLSKKGITPVMDSVIAFKILLLSMFFSVDPAYFIREIESRRKLRRFL